MSTLNYFIFLKNYYPNAMLREREAIQRARRELI